MSSRPLKKKLDWTPFVYRINGNVAMGLGATGSAARSRGGDFKKNEQETTN